MSRKKSHHGARFFLRKPTFVAAVLEDEGMRTPPPLPPPTPQTDGKLATINDDIIVIGGKMIVFRR